MLNYTWGSERKAGWWRERCGKALAPEESSGRAARRDRARAQGCPLTCSAMATAGVSNGSGSGLDLGSAKETCDLGASLTLAGPHILFKL